MEEQPGVREIDTVEGLRALADPVRLAILSALDTRVPDGALPVMSVKELAQRLGEPQTKLYSTTGQPRGGGADPCPVVDVTREIADAEAGDIPVNVAIGFYRPTM